LIVLNRNSELSKLEEKGAERDRWGGYIEAVKACSRL
jgi:hypothetical protein